MPGSPLVNVRARAGSALRRRVFNRYAMRFAPYPDALHRRVLGMPDYARHGAIALALNRIDADGVPGAIAEIGVFRGDLSVLLAEGAGGRKLYLFDTFGGFDPRDLHGRDDGRFRDTSAEAVRARMPAEAAVDIRQGYVPDTFAGLEGERFALAIVDLDLFDPTVASLGFLYPRLSPGGFVFVHDYNSGESDYACRRALDGFAATVPEAVLELADEWGTAVLRKNDAPRPAA